MLRKNKLDARLKPIYGRLLLTWAAMLLERLWRCFWPFVTLLLLVAGLLMLGLHDLVPVEAVWASAAIWGLAAAAALGRGSWSLRLPQPQEVRARLDQSMPGAPIQSLLDSQATSARDAGSVALWQAHQQRMAEQAQRVWVAKPDLGLASIDPFALRSVALLIFCTGALFGSPWRASSLSEITSSSEVGLNGPAWEGWIIPPRYTGMPVLYLNDQEDESLVLPVGSEISLRFYGETGALRLSEAVSLQPGDDEVSAEAEVGGAEGNGASSPQEDLTAPTFTVVQDGRFSIEGAGGRSWQVFVLADNPPAVSILGLPELSEDGALSLAFAAEDDYGIESGTVRISLDYGALDRRHGLRQEPEASEEILLELPLPLNGNHQEFQEFLIEDFSKHPWANLPVTFSFTVRDAAGQSAITAGLGAPLMAPRFFEPLAAALAEQRRDLLWSRDNTLRISQVLRTLAYRPQDLFKEAGHYLQMRQILRRLENFAQISLQLGAPGRAIRISDDERDEISEAIWALANALEHGDIGNALERMQRAKERLSQAMRDGASPEEIARLMQELRDATQDYLRQLQRQAQNQPQSGENGGQQENSMTLSQQDLQDMMDRIQELMEQGRMAEAQQALEEFQRMMENMRMTQGQSGQEGSSEGQQAMEELGETLREQQGLSDQAFRDLQEQFNPDAQAGQSRQNEGRNGGQGRGQQHEGGGGGEAGTGGTGGEGQRGESGQNGEGGQQGDQAPGGRESAQDGQGSLGSQGGLAARQRALREALRQQEQGLPLGQGAEGQAARDALDRAGRAMDQAGDALQQNDLADAIDHQSEAMEAIREGMRALGEALAENQRDGQQGPSQGQLPATGQNDPLGRSSSDGSTETNGRIGQTQRAHRRAWELLEELRRRSGEQERSEEERSYFQRLLEKF